MSSLKKLTIVTSLVVISLLVFMALQTRKNPQKVFETKSDNQGEVTVEVTPEKLGVNGGENIFEVKLDTHSLDLDSDFEKIVVLMDDLGNQYQAISWEGGRGGHHLEGKIVFPKLKAGAQKITLEMAQIGGGKRTFSWDLTK